LPFFKNQWQTFQSFVIEGWRHIVTGYDHLIFIMVLLASSITFRRWLWVLTSFTLAHGITYSIASMGWVQIQPSLIEPVIALTILLTAILALLKIQLKTSAEIMMIFSFGLFHGLGFASAMNTQLQDASFPLSIVIGFNLGIELGQLVVATTLALIFYLLRQHAHAYERARSGLLWIGFCAGVFWLFERF
jgi:hydrogenase/urease accessory protein HupE